MPAYFAYVDSPFRDRFMRPLGAFDTLNYWHQSDFKNFIGAKTVFPTAGQGPGGGTVPSTGEGAFDLWGESCGVVMSGTTSELHAALTPLTQAVKGNVTTIQSAARDLAAYYVRVLCTSTDNRTRTLINIGPLDRYWQNNDYKRAGKRYQWKKLWTKPVDAIKFIDVRDTLLQRAEGKTASFYY